MKLLLEQSAKGESNQVLLRSKLRAVSRRLGFNDVARERMELACNEMMTNQNKYAKGTGVVQLWQPTPLKALDVFAFDYGPGIADLQTALRDGFTTANTMGKGLGAIRRLAHASEIYTVPAERVRGAPWHGTAIWARFYPEKPAQPTFPHARYERTYLDGAYSGDLLHVRHDGNKTRWLHMDGLGHGREAYDAVAGLDRLLDDETDVQTLLHQIDQRLKNGRGAVGMVCEVNRSDGKAVVAGIGDMAAALIHGGEKKGVSFGSGILGHAHRGIQTVTVPFPTAALLITASDGLRRNWNLQSFPELWRLDPQMIALVLGNVAGRANDDQSVFVVNTQTRSHYEQGTDG